MKGAVMVEQKILRMRQLVERTGLSRSTLFMLMNPSAPQYDVTFPLRVRMTARTVGFLEADVNKWIGSRIAARGVNDE